MARHEYQAAARLRARGPLGPEQLEALRARLAERQERAAGGRLKVTGIALADGGMVEVTATALSTHPGMAAAALGDILFLELGEEWDVAGMSLSAGPPPQEVIIPPGATQEQAVALARAIRSRARSPEDEQLLLEACGLADSGPPARMASGYGRRRAQRDA